MPTQARKPPRKWYAHFARSLQVQLPLDFHGDIDARAADTVVRHEMEKTLRTDPELCRLFTEARERAMKIVKDSGVKEYKVVFEGD